MPVADFTLEASGGDVTLTDVVITLSNEVNAGVAFTSLRLFFDTGGDGVFSAGDEVDSFKDPNGAATFTFTENITVLDGLQRRLQVQVDLGNTTAVYGETFTFSIASSADLVRLSGGDSIAGTFPLDSNVLVVRNSLTELLSGSGNFSAPRNVERGTQNAPALHFKLDCKNAAAPGELVGIDLESLSATINMSSGIDADVIDGVELYGDDGDAAFEPGAGDNLILRRSAADAGKWQISGNVLTVIFDGAAIETLGTIAAGSNTSFWVAYDLNNTANAQLECQVIRTNVIGAEGTDGDFILTSPAAISGQTMFVVLSGGDPEGNGSGDGNSGEEGGCVAGVAAHPLALLLVLPLVALRRRRAKKPQ